MTTSRHARYDGSTLEYGNTPTGGYTFLVWGTEYSFTEAAPLVQAGKRNDPHFRRVLEQHADPSLVDIILAQETLLWIFDELTPMGAAVF